MEKPPERIELTGLVLRRLREGDALPLYDAVRESYDHLHPWMPWAAIPPIPEAQLSFLRMAQDQWASDEAYIYGLFAPSSEELHGTIGLHVRSGPDTLEIGYWLHVRHTGKGYMTTSAAVLTTTALELRGIEYVEIRCDLANTASAAVPRRLGYALDLIEDHEIDAPAESGKRMLWRMPRAAYAGSPAERLTQESVRPGTP